MDIINKDIRISFDAFNPGGDNMLESLLIALTVAFIIDFFNKFEISIQIKKK